MKTILTALCLAIAGCAGMPPITASFAGNYGHSSKSGLSIELHHAFK